MAMAMAMAAMRSPIQGRPNPNPTAVRSRSSSSARLGPRAASSSSDSGDLGFPEHDSQAADPRIDQKKGYKSLLLAVGIPLAAGSITGALNRPDSWYFQLNKPSWTPPAPLFGLAWSLIYPLMGFASWLVWRNGGFGEQGGALKIYGAQLVVNLLWQVFFFGLHNPFLAFIDICALLVLLAVCINSFRKASPAAANLMKVYFLWVAFASALNFKIWRSNPVV